MTDKNPNISSLYKKYFDLRQYDYALKIADLGYACDRIPEALWRMYKRDCLRKIGGASSSIKYTEGFVDDIISLPFFSELYHNRGLNKSNQVKKDSIQKLINAINKFYYTYIDLPSFCEFYDKFTVIDQDSRLIQLSFVDELVGAKVTLDVFQYLLSNMELCVQCVLENRSHGFTILFTMISLESC